MVLDSHRVVKGLLLHLLIDAVHLRDIVFDVLDKILRKP